MKVHFKLVAHGSEDWKKAVELRESILRLPLGAHFTQSELKEEKKHFHVVGLSNNKIVATAVLVPENNKVKMQRVAVLDHFRSSGIGSEMMKFCESYTKENGFNYIYCHARDSAVNFYLKNKYLSDGEYFDEDDIPHLKMVKKL